MTPEQFKQHKRMLYHIRKEKKRAAVIPNTNLDKTTYVVKTKIKDMTRDEYKEYKRQKEKQRRDKMTEEMKLKYQEENKMRQKRRRYEMSEEEKKKYQEQDRLRQRRYRDKMKEEENLVPRKGCHNEKEKHNESLLVSSSEEN